MPATGGSEQPIPVFVFDETQLEHFGDIDRIDGCGGILIDFPQQPRLVSG